MKRSTKKLFKSQVYSFLLIVLCISIVILAYITFNELGLQPYESIILISVVVYIHELLNMIKIERDNK